ncbi:MAG: hypothetical protein KAU20_03705 [Nanoarchaeota archaeon]|nr:hypothetical protein [Nanoarchaeota archaeon]
MKTLKFLSIFLIILAIANIILFAMRKITPLLFWFVIIFSAVMAYILIPYANRKFQMR